MALIDLDKAIEVVEWYNTNPQHFTVENVIDDLKNEPKAHGTVWHPYQKEKPPKNKRYIVTVVYCDGETDVGSLLWQGTGIGWSYVTAWAELPEPYRKEGAEE